MSNPVFRLQLGWRSYLMSASDAAKVADILARSQCVETGWCKTLGGVLIDSKPEAISFVTVTEDVITQEQYDAVRETEKRLEEGGEKQPTGVDS